MYNIIVLIELLSISNVSVAFIIILQVKVYYKTDIIVVATVIIHFIEWLMLVCPDIVATL